MATDLAGRLVRRIQRAVSVRGTGDATLLERFVTGRDEAAFEQFVRAHGPMVLGVCERLLGNRPDAEDAFQATFLILARKAGSIRTRTSAAGWLYAVACRTALEARAMRSRRRRTEAQIELPLEPVAPVSADVSELRGVIDAELSRLPEKYRTAVVLCDLEGCPRAEAARQLGIPEGTLSSRLAAGRQKLAARLLRRGFAPPAMALAALLPRPSWAVAIPTPLLNVTVRSASAFATGLVPAAPLSPAVAALTQGVLRAMYTTRIRLVVVLLVPLVAASAAVLAASSPTPGDPTPAAPAVAAAQPAPAVASAAEGEKQDDPADDDRASKPVGNARPVVVKTVPQAGDDKVDVGLKEIRVTFSKDMEDESWSWSSADEGAVPKTTGKPYYDKDKRTCVLPVRLEPGKTYAFWLNSSNFHNFKDADGRPAVPYLLVFHTGKK